MDVVNFLKKSDGTAIPFVLMVKHHLPNQKYLEFYQCRE